MLWLGISKQEILIEYANLDKILDKQSIIAEKLSEKIDILPDNSSDVEQILRK